MRTITQGSKPKYPMRKCLLLATVAHIDPSLKRQTKRMTVFCLLSPMNWPVTMT